MNINKALDKEYEDEPLNEIADLPVEALQGISPTMAGHLASGLNVKTVRDLAESKYVRWAQAICALGDCEG